MRYFTKNDISSEIINAKKQEKLEDIDITLYDGNDPFHSVIDLYFVKNKTKLESISNQVVEESDNYYYYQIPFENRGYGIIPTKVVITTDVTDYENIFDDGHGNLQVIIDENKIKVGNIFYNSGVILLYHNDLIENITSVDIIFKRKVEFLKREYYVNVNRNEFPTSANDTFLDSDAPYPYITNIILFNEYGEAIKKASLSKPIKTEEDMLLILEMFE